MIRTIDAVLGKAFGSAPWLTETELDDDALIVLAEALGSAWSVQREVDCEGDASIIVMPLQDENLATFILYERHGLALVGINLGDEWLGDEGFGSVQAATGAIIDKIGRFAR